MNGSEDFDPAPLPEGQAARLAALLDALGDIPITAAERASLTWLAGFEAATVENVAGLIWRARGRSAVVAARGHGPEMERQRQADLLRGQLLDLCEWAGIDPGEDPHAAVLAHLRGTEGPGRGVSS